MNSDNINNSTVNSDEISLKDLILKIQDWYRYLLSKWIIILACVLIGGALGFAYAYIKKPVYTATTTFVLESGDNGGGALGQYAGLASMVGIDIGGGGGGIFQGDNILELYKSRTMIEKTLLSELEGDTAKLIIDRYIEINKLKGKWEQERIGNINFKSISPKLERTCDSIIDKTVEDINKNYLSVSKPDKKLSIIKVDVTSEDDVFAKSFNNELVKNVNDFYIETKTKKTKQNVDILQYKTDSVRSVMNGAIYSAVVASDETPNLNPTKQVKRLAPMQKAQFSAETNKAVLTELIKNLELTKISLLKETPLIQVIDSPIFPLKEDKLGKTKGVILGAFLFGFFVVVYFSGRRILNNIFTSEQKL